MASSSKRQTTMAKLQREQRVREKRQLKAEKKQAVKEAKAAGIPLGGEPLGEAATDALDAAGKSPEVTEEPVARTP